MKAKTVSAHQPVQSMAWSSTGIHILLGALYIALLSQIEIPLKPVPVTLQTFAIFTLALFQGSRKSFFSLLLYLFAATLGLPVFPVAYADPFWILHPSAGYCLSFPIAAYIAGKFAELKFSFSAAWMLVGLSCAQLFIYLIGVSWLGVMIGWQQALIVGFYPFVLFDAIKIFAAFSMRMAAKKLNLYENEEMP